MRMSFLASPRTASIVVGLVVLALIPIALVAVIDGDGDGETDDPTEAAASSDDAPVTRDELAALERRVLVLEDRDERRGEEFATLRDDVEAATATLAELDADDLPGAIAAIDDQLAELVDTLTVLDEELAVVAGDVAGQRAELDATAGELRGAIDEVRGGITTLRGDLDRTGGNVEVLRGEVATLRDRLDRLQRGG